MKKKLNKLNYFYLFCYLFVFPTFLFARSFMGIKLVSFRIGELLVAFFLFFTIYQIIDRRKIINFFGKKLYNSFFLISFFVPLSIILKQGSLFDTYVYKSSSYIWLMSAIFFSYKFFDEIKIEKAYLYAMNILLCLSYTFSVIYFPNFLKEFFIKYSDKFDYLKASEILLLFVTVIFINNRFLPNFFKYTFEFNLLLSSIFFALFIYKSRGAALSFIIFFILEFNKFRNESKYSLGKKFILIIFCVTLFSISTLLVVDIQPDDESYVSSSEVINELLDNKNTNIQSFFSIYLIQNIDDLDSFKFLKNGRIFSTDGNINWRFQIWQDVLLQSGDNFKYLFGHGYFEKIPAMKNPLYVGEDGSNEYVHNYFINIFARGGLVQVFLFLYFYFQLIKLSNYRLDKYDLLNFLIPLIFVSLFDSSMSNPHFPFLFFLYYGQILIIMNNKSEKVKY